MRKIIEKTTRIAAFALALLAAGGAWADFAKTNPVTGETENYTWKFVGTDTWNGTQYWQDSNGDSPTGVPGKTGESNFDPFFFDSSSVNINAGMSVEGWTLRMGLYNGATVTMNNLQKFQSGTMWVTVDETSKLRINNVNDKYEGDALNLYSACEAGIEWTCALSGAQGTGLPFNYYLKGNGSVAFTTITAANCSHTIKQADVLLNGNAASGKGKMVNSKTLVSFTSSTQSFLADATIKVKYANGSSCKDIALSSVTATTPTLTTAGDIGDCELVQTSTGIVLYYVDYAYTPSINLNFTDSSANLTTENYVGLAGYAAPGSAWNNIAAAVGTTSGTIKMIDATGTASVNSGISVQIATTRGSWRCSSLTAATDIRHGYIDEDSNNTTPTVTVSGIPFSKYRVIVYHSTDSDGASFGYDTINETNLTYVDGALTTGTSDWGNAGGSNTAKPIEEGVNTLVSGVLSGSTATIVSHKGSSSRGCVAAVQIVEASAASLEETGGYAADASLIVFKNATLAELTGATLSARFGGDWSGTAKTLKMTFNNFDRSAEASGTITCEAQVQHDDAVKGLLLTFTQVGDDVAVKTTGAKYKTGTVGESIASATDDATGHYAIYNFALPRTPETSATIVWESGEFEMTKVGSDGNAYSFSSFGGLSVNGDGNLVVDTANAQGAIIELPDASKTAVSVLIKYSNLATETGGNATLANCAINSGNTTYYLGARTINKGTLPLTAYYAGNAYPFDNATYGRGNVPSMDTGSGYFLFAHGSSNGTYAYSGETIGALDGGYNTQLKWGGYTITKVSIGGGFENSRAYCWKGSGTVIEKVAIFLGSIKTPSDLADYYFPSAVAKDYEKWEYAKAMLTRAGSGELAAGTYKLFDAHSGLDTDTNYNGNTSNYSLFGYTGSGVRFWKYLCYASLDNPVGWQAPGLALRFSASETSANKTIGGTFGPVQFAGLYVESGATGYSFTQTGSKRDTIFGDPSGGSAETWFVFDEPFAVQRNGTMWFAGTVNLTLTESTDVLTLNTSASDGSNDCSPHIVESITKQGNGVQVTTSATTAGGTLKMHGAGYLTATKLTAAGATLDFSDIGSRYNAATPFINCPLVIDGDTKFVFPEGIVLPYTYKVATSITANGTPASEYTDANGNVFTVPLAIDTANGTVTISDDLTTATKIVVNGALTISAATAADIVVNSTGTLTLAAGGSLSGTVTGSGTVVCSQGVDLSGGGFDNASGWTGKVQLTGDATIPTTYYDESAYGNANSSLEVVSGHAALTAATSLPGTVNVASGATLYMTSSSIESLSISGTNSGTVNLQVASSLTTLTLGDGIARGAVVYPSSLTTLNVSLTETVADDGVKSFTVAGATPTGGTLTLTRADGTTTNVTGTVDGSAVSFAWTPAVSGAACWVDYEMNGSNENTGMEGKNLQYDTGFNGGNSYDDSKRLYVYSHPYRDNLAAYPDTWTAAIRCTVPNNANAAIITFGNQSAGLLGLIAGNNPETQMKLVQTTGNSAYTERAEMNVTDATSAQHVYVFSVENKRTLKAWCDGESVLNTNLTEDISIGAGFQIGSVVYGVGNTGIVRWWSGVEPASSATEAVQKAAQIDCLRLYKGVLGPNAIRQLSTEFPAVKLYRGTVTTDTAWGDITFSPAWDGGNEFSKIILTVSDDATVTLPESITVQDFQIDIASGKTLTLTGTCTMNVANPIVINDGTLVYADAASKAIAFNGTGSLKFANGTMISGTLSGTAKVEIPSGANVMVTTGSIANPITGAGGLVFTTARPASALSFSSWTGIVQIPAITTDEAVNFNYYGVAGSTVYVTSMSAGWLADAEVLPELYLLGNMTLNHFSTSYVNTIDKLSGVGTFSLAADGTAEGYADGYFLVKDVSDFTGSISVAAPGLAIGSAKPASPTTYGQIVLTTTATIPAGKTWTASNGIVLGSADATLTNTDGALATAPTTSVADSYVKLTGTTYSVDAYNVVTFVQGNSTVARTDSLGTAIKDGDTITFTVTPDAGCNLVSVVPSTGSLTGDGPYSYTVSGDVTITVTTQQKTATVSGVTFTYGADYTNATVTATVTGDATSATLSYDGHTYNANVVNGTVTFNNVAVSRGNDIYAPVAYEITAKDGDASVTTTGGTGSSVAADSTAWVNENAGTTGTAAAGGSWSNEVTYANNVASVSDNTFTAVNCSTGDLVTVTVENVVYTELSDMDVSGIAADSQGAFCLGTNVVNDAVVTNFMILAKEGGAFVWKPAEWSAGTPAFDTPYNVEFTFDYTHGKYSVKINGTALSTNSATVFDLCTEQTSVKAVDFMGAGTLSAIQGAGYSGYMVKDSVGNCYATIADAIDAYSDANGPYFVLHAYSAGSVPRGWKVETVDGVMVLKRNIKGVMILTY